MKNTFKKLPQIRQHHVGCLCCQGMENILPMNTVLYNGFGGWYISKDGEHFFTEDVDKEWDDNKTLAFVEQKAKREPGADWRAILDTPLHGEVYQRQRGKWVLVEQNEGFA